MKFILFLLCLVASYGTARSQAFDGVSDDKLFLGYANLGGKSAIDFQYDRGLGDWISAGGQVTYLFLPKKDGQSYTLPERANLTVFCRVHFAGIFTMPSQFSPYAGIDLSVHTFGMHGGVKYNFSERWGVYAQAQQGLCRLWGDENIWGNFFDRKFGVSLGITYNIF